MADKFIGLISGTSMDGIDAVLVAFDRSFILIDQLSQPIPDDLQKRIFQLAHNEQVDLRLLGETDAELGDVFARAADNLLKRNALQAKDIVAIGSHGQTIWHSPDSRYKFTIQIGNPHRIAHATGITTVADFRNRNMVAGGEGAPFAPAFHRAVFSHPQQNRAVLNLGGIANLTYLPASPEQKCLGFDSGPASVLMDHWMSKHRNQPFDRDGAWAASGQVNAQLLKKLMQDEYLQRQPPKSTGREHYHMLWLQQQLQGFEQLGAEDVQATLSEFTVQSVKQAIEHFMDDIQTLIVCGGGAHNLHLMQSLQRALNPLQVDSSERHGLHPDWVEAVAFAWYARQTLAGTAVDLVDITGASRNVILGAIYPA